MNRARRHVHLLHVLAAASPAQRKAILKSASNQQIKTLCEICQNLLSGNIPTNKIRKSSCYKRLIRLLANRSIPISRKRKLFTTNKQVGGFLPLVLPGVLSLIGGLVEYYQLSKPEIRLEDNISNLLKEKETPDDVKAKLLSDLIPKYQRAMEPIQSTTPFEIPSELLAESELPDEKLLEIPSKLNMMAKYIGYVIPKTQRKFILPILEKN
ncbi:uncharacterized protein TNCV_3986361 [Trichonephila clavipes]|nr:uncharacterized protein TNCV_3986361 [Trichonephila clavipes]